MSDNNGISQQERLQRALQQPMFAADEQRLEDLLSLAVEYAGAVNYIDINNYPDGDWRRFFVHDETVVIASIMIERIDRMRQQFDVALERAITAQTFPSVIKHDDESPIFLIHQIGEKLDRWSQLLVHSNSSIARDLTMLISNLLAKMEYPYAKIRQLYAGKHKAESQIDQQFWSNTTGKTPEKELHNQIFRHELKSLFHSLIKVVDMLQRAAARRLPASLTTGQHDPANAMLISFVMLYQQAQKKINRFTQRHLDFYYQQVLQMQPKPMRRDRTVLIFQPAVAGKPLLLPKGTEFLAPVSASKADIVFSADDDLVITDVQVAKVYSLFFERNSLNSPERDLEEKNDANSQYGQRQYPTNCWFDVIATPMPEAVLDNDKLEFTPLFGARRNNVLRSSAVSARIGFALASTTLLLREGHRKITVVLQFDVSHEQIETDSLQQRLEAIAKSLGAVQSDVDYKVLRSIFSIYLTTASKWLQVNDYNSTFIAERNEMEISFVLGSDEDAITPYVATIHGEGYRVSTPVIRFELNNQGYLYPYGLLQGLPMRAIRIDVKVSGLRDLILHNNIGQLSAVVPFNPFGPIPQVGSYLIVGSAETACKQLSSFELDVEWGGLPVNPGGFASYYSGYRRSNEMTDIVVAISTQYGGKWLPSGQEPLLNLFEVQKENHNNAVIPKNARFSFNQVMQFSNSVNAVSNSKIFSYSPAGKGGFFKMTLVGPDFAFGHKDYANDLATTLIENNQPKSLFKSPFSKMRQQALPNLPYTPLITSVSANYTASQTIDMINLSQNQSSGKVMHLHPNGWEMLSTKMRGNVTLLPEYKESGNLLIGLRSQDVPGLLTLFFHLREDSLYTSDQEDSLLKWYYLANNLWKPLSVSQVLADSTKGFRRPGIVTLQLPEDISRHNTVLPADLYWLRLSAENNLSHFCSLYSIYAQALQVSRIDRDLNAADTPVIIAAGTIKRPRTAVAGLAGITQIIPSFGGRLPESPLQLQIRTAERLKHKQRAVVPADYERLVLEEFPSIARVKCFSNISLAQKPDGGMVPGNVLVVVLPSMIKADSSAILPNLNGYLLTQVGTYLQQLASPFVKVEVVSPEYQRIQVRCQVKFKKEQEIGRCLNQLNTAISDFIAPWCETGNQDYFGWCLRQNELESFILQHDFVDYVTRFSMLSVVSRSGNEFKLIDTVKDGIDLVPSQPWCIPVPILPHALSVIDEFVSADPVAAGINDLTIGRTFIISREADNAQKE